jgi:hypothetical protein
VLAVVALIVLTSIQACGSEGGLNLLDDQRPAWLYGAILFTVGYLVAAPFLAGRAADGRLVAALPIVGNTAAAAFAMLDVLRFMTASGESPRTAPRATAFAIAEAIVPLLAGSVVAAVLSLLIRFSVLRVKGGGTTTRAGSVVLCAGALVAMSIGGFMWYLTRARPPDAASLVPVAALIFALAALVVVLALAAMWLGRHRPASLERWLVAFAIGCVFAACVLWLTQQRLEMFADGSGR